MMGQEKSWHLAENEKEAAITDIELNLWRAYYSFIRWQEDCERAANSTNLTSEELAILHVIRMKDRAKSITEIGRLLTREDVDNIKYSTRKLTNLGLIEKTKISKILAYQITPLGIKNTDNYIKARKAILMDSLSKEANSINLSELSRGLLKLKAIYDEATKNVSSFESIDKD